MPRHDRPLLRALGWEAFLLALPVVALVIFGFLALRWERRAQEEGVRVRCEGLAEPLRDAFREELGRVNLATGWPGVVADLDLPIPADGGDSLARFTEGEFQAVLGGAPARSEAGVPLRPLAALRLLREEVEPARLEELSGVIASEPNFLTSRLLEEAEERHRTLDLALPTVLEDWRSKLLRQEAYNILLSEVGPELLGANEQMGWISHRERRWFVLRDGEDLVVSTGEDLKQATAASLATIEGALPKGMEAELQLGGPGLDRERVVAESSGTPLIWFVVADEALMRSATAGRRALFVAFLVSAALLSALGIFLLARTVGRERELSDRKGNLVAAVSHEMRTPVASIRLLAENLATGVAGSAERRESHLHRLVEQSERLSTLVENVLSYSKREAGRSDWNCEVLDVKELLAEGIGHFEVLAESRNVTLTCRLGEFATPPRGDAKALQQALVNLLDNALKHSPEGSEVVCGAEPDSYRSDRWRLWVEDHGPGVKAEERERIFEAFYRVGSELRRETSGTGLGLALVKQVADLHGGEAVCRETSTGGAHFELLLPLDPINPQERSS